MEFQTTTTINVTPIADPNGHRCYVLPGITKEIIEENGWRKTGVVDHTGYGYVRSDEEVRVGICMAGEHKGELFLMEHTNNKTAQNHFHYVKVYYKK